MEATGNSLQADTSTEFPTGNHCWMVGTGAPILKSSLARKLLQRPAHSNPTEPVPHPHTQDTQTERRSRQMLQGAPAPLPATPVASPHLVPNSAAGAAALLGPGARGTLNLYMPQGRKSISMPKGGNYCSRRSPTTTSHRIVLEPWTGKKCLKVR